MYRIQIRYFGVMCPSTVHLNHHCYRKCRDRIGPFLPRLRRVPVIRLTESGVRDEHDTFRKALNPFDFSDENEASP